MVNRQNESTVIKHAGRAKAGPYLCSYIMERGDVGRRGGRENL